ncbi:hypothetical protein OM416_20150 [Paenibacillus sp. LS1]|uniref:hypothetical protein n=1 Tax=Paenibacillus sp. LS1 TaxID=2992120 RepID=UPI00222FC53A|nr:hypothetical protein [Paenibacillus sp. LS1]MCW3793909.1 hypothetical protein [Paenibacillus sp. LS1]
MIETDYLNGMNLGLGYNTMTNSVHPAVALDNINDIRAVVNATGQKVYFQLELLSNSLSLSEQLKMSASASLSYGTTSGSAKAQFISSFKQNSFTVYVLVRVHVENQQTLLDLTSAKMNDKVALMYATDIIGFTNLYGDSFVYGILSGGDYFGVLEIESKSAEEYRSIKASLSGKAMFGVISGEAAGSFEREIRKITTSYKMKATIYRDGAEGVLQGISSDQLIQEAIAFPNQVLGGKGVPFSVLLLPYTQIPHPPSQTIGQTGDPYCLENFGKYYERLIRQRNDLQYAIENQQLFPGLPVTEVNERLDKIQNEIEKVKTAARAYSSNPYVCPVVTVLDELFVNLIPQQVIPSRLGHKWYWTMGAWFALFVRDGDTNIFKGDFKLGTDVIKASLEIHESGNDLFIIRRDETNFPWDRHDDTVYKGFYTSENTAEGVDLKDGSITWNAKIEN